MKDIYRFFAKLTKEAYDMWDNNQRIAYIDFTEGFSGNKIFCNLREIIPLLIVYLHHFSNYVLKEHATLQQVERFLYFYIPDKKCCGLGGGDWEEVKTIFENIERNYNVLFVAYDIRRDIINDE